jgi:hypothetical protein
MFKDDAIREQVRGMLKKGMKTPEIVAGLPAGSRHMRKNCFNN